MYSGGSYSLAVMLRVRGADVVACRAVSGDRRRVSEEVIKAMVPGRATVHGAAHRLHFDRLVGEHWRVQLANEVKRSFLLR